MSKTKEKCPECGKEYQRLDVHMRSHRKQYTAIARVMGKEHKGEGETIYEAIGNIKPGGVAGMVILTVKGEEKSKDQVLPMITAKRMFMAVGLTRETAIEQVSKMFDGV